MMGNYAWQPAPAHAAVGINQTINFQGRLLSNTGAVVADGSYNMRFKIYQDGAGTAANNGGSGLKWTELWQNQVASGSTSGVTVKNGYFSVNLGAFCAFTTSSCQGTSNTVVDWNQSVLWLSMDVGGTAVTNTPTYDGELLPMRRMASAVYAINAGQLGGLTSGQFIQNVSPAAGQQTATINILSGLAANVAAAKIQTVASATAPVLVLEGGATPGAGGDLLQLQNSSGTPLGRIDSSGNLYVAGSVDTQTGTGLSLGGTAATSISIGSATTSTTITVGQSTVASTLNVASAALTTAVSQTVNIANGSQTTANSTLTVNVLSGASGSSGTAVLNLGNSERVTQIDIGNVAADAARSLNFGTGSNIVGIDTLNIGTGATTVAGGKTVHIADGTPSGSGTNLVTIGSIAALANTTTVQGGNGTTAVTIQAAASGNINVGTNAVTGKVVNVGSVGTTANTTAVHIADSTGAVSQTVTIGSLASASSTTIQGGTGNILLTTNQATASTIVKTATTNSVQAFQVQNTAGMPIFNVDTTGSYIINNGTKPAGNELENPSFEAVGNVTDASGWVTGGGTSIVTDAANAHTGNNVYETTGVVDSYGSKYYAVQPGDTIYYEGYVKRSVGGSGTGGFFLEFRDKDLLNPAFTTDTWTDPGTSYTLRANTQTVPAGKYFVHMAITERTGATGTWYFDDLYLKRGLEQSTMTFRNSANSAVAFQVQNAGSVNMLAVDNSTATVSVGVTGATATASTVNIASSSAAGVAQAVTIGSAAANTSSISILQGGSNTTQAIQLLPNVAGGIMIGAGAGTGTITLGQSTAANTINIGSANPNGVTQAINIGNGSETVASSAINVNILSGAAGTNGTASLLMGNNDRVTQIDIGNVAADAARTINIGSGSNTVGVDTLNIGTGATTVASGKTVHIADGTPTGSGTNQVTIGSTAGASSTTLQGGTGNINFITNAATAGSLFKTNTNSSTALGLQNASGFQIFNASTVGNPANLVANGGFENNVALTWAQVNGTATITRITTNDYAQTASMHAVVSSATQWAGVKYPVTLTNSTTYALSFYAKLISSSAGSPTIIMGYSSTGAIGGELDCDANMQPINTSSWTRYSCTFTTPSTNSGAPYIYIEQATANAYTFDVDNVLLAQQSSQNQAYYDGAIDFSGAAVNGPFTVQNTVDSTPALQVYGGGAVYGNFTIYNTDMNKSYRFRTSGGSLDLETSGIGVPGELWMSGWTGNNFTGSQINFFRMSQASRLVMVGTGSASTTPIVLQLDNKSTSGDPTGFNGGMYYNASTATFRCYEASEWRNCVSSVESNNINNASNVGGNSGGMTSATYVNYNTPTSTGTAGASSLTFTKLATATKISITLTVSAYASVAPTALRIGVGIAGTDYDCGHLNFNAANQHMQVSCQLVLSGIASGSQTAQIRWRRFSGTGNFTTDSNDWTSMTVQETD